MISFLCDLIVIYHFLKAMIVFHSNKLGRRFSELLSPLQPLLFGQSTESMNIGGFSGFSKN
jgi:hypothetical protein